MGKYAEEEMVDMMSYIPDEECESIPERDTEHCSKCGKPYKHRLGVAYGDYCLECRWTDEECIRHDNDLMGWRNF